MKLVARKQFIVAAGASAITGTLYTPDSDETVTISTYAGIVPPSTQTLTYSWQDPFNGAQTVPIFGPGAVNIPVRVAAGTPLMFTTSVNSTAVENDIQVISFVD